MYRHSVASWVKRTVMIKEHQLHFFLSVQSLLSHVYTESVSYKEILRTTLSIFCSFSLLLKKHSVMNILTFKTVKNDLCFLWIVWQSLFYNSSFTSAFINIYLRSIILSNKFWSFTSTEINMSATVIETVCIDLLIISECIICVIQCCTLLFKRFINTFCFCLNKVSAFSFCLLSKYSIKKLYCDSIKDHLICHSVSFLTVIKYFRFL